MRKCNFSSSYLKRVSWNSEVLLSNAVLTPSLVNKWQNTSMQNLILHDMYSERHSEHFSKAIHALDIDLSEDFLAFEHLWLSDELNHYAGFRYLFGLIIGEPVDNKVEKQSYVPNFSNLFSFFQDEFHLCLLLAYDEIVTTRLYIEEYPLYDEAGDPFISRWIRYVARDEAYHFGNLLKVLLANFSHRFHEIPIVVNRLINQELSSQNYSETFVLDRAGYCLSHSFLFQCVQPLLRFARKHIS